MQIGFCEKRGLINIVFSNINFQDIMNFYVLVSHPPVNVFFYIILSILIVYGTAEGTNYNNKKYAKTFHSFFY